LNELFPHQAQCLEISRLNPSYAFFLETGTGKTRLGLEIISDKRRKALVVCPLRVIRAWLDDSASFTPHLRIISGWAKTAAKKRKLIEGDYDVLVINFDTFRAMGADLQRQGFQILIIDESSKIKNPKSRTGQGKRTLTKTAIDFADLTENKYEMSGTPFPNGMHEAFSQGRFLSPSFWLNDMGTPMNFYSWRRYYFEQHASHSWLWMPKPGAEKAIMDKFKKMAIFIKKEEVLKDLPPQSIIVNTVQMNKEEKSAHDGMMKDWIAYAGDATVFAKNSLVKLMKARQATSGFMFDNEGEAKMFEKSSKIAALKEILEENYGKRILIFAEFRAEIDRIYVDLRDAGIRVDRLYGGMSIDDGDVALQRFRSASTQVLVSHPASIGHGITVTECSLTVWTSLSYSSELFKQANDRTHRIGQKNPTTIIVLLAEGSIDETVFKIVTKKISSQEAMLEVLKK